MFGLNTPRQLKKFVQPNLHCVMCDFFPCCRTRVICCLCWFKSGEKREVEAGDYMMGTVISVPSMGAASILLIPGVIPPAQQRNQTQRGRQDMALQPSAQPVLRCTHKHSVLTQQRHCRIGSYTWLIIKLMFLWLDKYQNSMKHLRMICILSETQTLMLNKSPIRDVCG